MALLFARLIFHVFSESENILFVLAQKMVLIRLCDGISETKDHQAEDESHASKNPGDDVDLVLQLFLICLRKKKN